MRLMKRDNANIICLSRRPGGRGSEFRVTFGTGPGSTYEYGHRATEGGESEIKGWRLSAEGSWKDVCKRWELILDKWPSLDLLVDS